MCQALIVPPTNSVVHQLYSKNKTKQMPLGAMYPDGVATH